MSQYPYPSGQPVYPAAPPPRPKRKVGLIIALAVGLPLLLCCGGFGVFALVAGDSLSVAGTGSPSPAVSKTPLRERDGASRAKVGECINVYTFATSAPGPDAETDGSTPSRQLVTATERVPCREGAYKVLRRINATTDTGACSSVEGAERGYYHDASKPSRDFVLCLRKV